MPKYDNLSKELQERIRSDREGHWVNPYAFLFVILVRRRMYHARHNHRTPDIIRDLV